MNLISPTNIIRITAETRPFDTLFCSLCGSTEQMLGVCRNCALDVLDLTLRNASEVFPIVVEEAGGETQNTHSVVQTRYDHYAVCLSPEGTPLELGRGSMGITYKATDTHLGRQVALKIINTSNFAGSKARERFLHEARSAAGLRHPNIASIHHLGLDETNCFYAMEYIQGETLEAYIRRHGAMPCKSALNIIAQAARALSVAHAQGFIHRDIKPANIMLVTNEQSSDEAITVKLIDFGLVKALSNEEDNDLACVGYFAGTPFYASPEQLESRFVDARSDIYSLGMCLSYMLAGKTLVLATTSSSSQEPPDDSLLAMTGSLRSIPAPIVDLVRSMTSRDPAARPQTAAELLTRILRYSAHKKESHWRELSITGASLLCVVMFAGGLLRFLPVTETKMAPTVESTAHLEAQMLFAQGEECRRRYTKADNLRAIDYYSKAIKLNPASAETHAALAMAYFQAVARFGGNNAQLDLALTHAQRAIVLEPGAPAGFASLGAIRSLQGQHWEALVQVHRALELDAKYLPAMRNFSLLWSTVGQPQRGLPWAKAAARLEPTNTTGWGAAADASVDLAADEQAEDFYRQCLKINPGWMSAHCGLLHIHLLQGNFAQANRDYVIAESVESGLILPLTLKAQIALFSTEYVEAEKTYRRLLAMDRNGFVNYYGGISYLSALGFLRCRAGDLVEGTALLDEASKLHVTNSDGPQAIYDLAAIRAVQGRVGDAFSLLRQAIAAGWMDYRSTRLDPRFESLRLEAGFQQLLEALRIHVTQMREESERLCAKPLAIADYPVRLP